jgi:pilus assembly protein Flp/PilA
VTIGGIASAGGAGSAPEDGDIDSEEGGVQMIQLYAGLQTWWAELKERASEERGATAVEYALMVALIAVVIILAVTLVGTSAEEKFFEVGEAIDNT